MLNRIRLAKQDGSKLETNISIDVTTKEVKEYYSDNNFLLNKENQVVQIEFLTKFKDMLPGERLFTTIAYYNSDAECYLF